MDLTLSDINSKIKKGKLTRYRITLDLMIDRSTCESPMTWNWKKLMELNEKEQVNDVYVENLGDYSV
jgi:hypothetical protein